MLVGMEWRAKARCKDLPIDLFFDFELEQEAKAVCKACPVIKDCLYQEVSMGIPPNVWYGVSGGRTAKERRKVLFPIEPQRDTIKTVASS